MSNQEKPEMNAAQGLDSNVENSEYAEINEAQIDGQKAPESNESVTQTNDSSGASQEPQEDLHSTHKNKYGISKDEVGKKEFRLRVIGMVLKKKAIKLLCMTVAFAVFLSVLTYAYNLNSGKATMMLNYEQSVNGLAPNGTRFNISDFTSDEVMNLIIKNAGLEGKITATELEESIEINSMVEKKPISKENYYIPTSYKITYSSPSAITDIDADNMLEIICNTFNQYFHDRYTMSTHILRGNYDDLDELEYSQIGAYISMRIDAINQFLDKRNTESGKFKSESGETFNSIKKRADNLKDYNLNTYSAYIWENGVVRDSATYTNTLNYLNTKNGRDKREYMNEYKIRRDVITYYNSIMSTSVLIPTIYQTNYYMARTKTGVDYLASEASFYLQTSKALEKGIKTNSDKLKKVRKEADDDQHKKADAMIEKMTAEIQEIEKLAIQTDKEYKLEQERNYITFTVSDLSFFDRIPLKKVAALSLVFLLMAFFVYYKECSCTARKAGANK